MHFGRVSRKAFMAERTIRLFQEVSMDDECTSRKQRLQTDCRALTNEEVLAEEIEALSERIAQRYYFDVPTVLVDEMYGEDPELPAESPHAIVKLHFPNQGKSGRCEG
jgi:hypothetical protein